MTPLLPNPKSLAFLYGPPLLAACIYLALGYIAVSNGHPHEDAYILFIFAENLANFGTINFYENGPPAEGATDFLWMLIISALYKAGLPSGLAVQFLNAAGVFLIGHLLMREAGSGRLAILAASGFVLALPAARFVHAGYYGFSPPLYCAVILLLFLTVARYDKGNLIWVPPLSLLLGLFRPDGVVLGAGFVLVAFLYCPPELRQRYLKIVAAVTMLGCCYFIWRWSYFGEFLPLPLYVKSAFDGPPSGLTATAHWARLNIGYGLVALAILFLPIKDKRRLAAGVLPIIVLLAIMALSHNSQNVSYRFQAPGGVALFSLSALALICLANHIETMLAKVSTIGLLAVLLSFSGISELFTLRNSLGDIITNEYIDVFPVALASYLPPKSRIALTEAGRFPYWVSGEKFDLVGLNTAYAAHHGADADYIEQITPDLIFFHAAKTARLIDIPCAGRRFCQYDLKTFNTFVEKATLPAVESIETREERAPLAVYDFLSTTKTDYQIFVAWYFGEFAHFFALAPTLGIEAEVFGNLLGEAYANPERVSYLEAYRLIRGHE